MSFDQLYGICVEYLKLSHPDTKKFEDEISPNPIIIPGIARHSSINESKNERDMELLIDIGTESDLADFKNSDYVGNIIMNIVRSIGPVFVAIMKSANYSDEQITKYVKNIRFDQHKLTIGTEIKDKIIFRIVELDE